MTESRLSRKTKLCQLLETLNNDQCHQAVDFFLSELCDNPQQFLIKLLFAHDLHGQDFWTNDFLANMETHLYSILNNDKNSQKQQHQTATENEHENENENISTNLVSFPLMKLPIDIVQSISYFLGYKDILRFEKVCRMFYQLINNNSFLQKYNDFQVLKLCNHDLKYIDSNFRIGKCDLFKFSKCKHLSIELSYLHANANQHNRGGILDFQLQDLLKQEEWKNSMIFSFENLIHLCQNSDYHGNWLISLFKSIEKLTITADGYILLSILPIQLLFGEKNSSNLVELELDLRKEITYGWVDDELDHLRNENPFVIFETSLQTQLVDAMGNGIKLFKCIDLYMALSSPRNKPIYDAVQLLKTSNLSVDDNELDIQWLIQDFLNQESNLVNNLTSLKLILYDTIVDEQINIRYKQNQTTCGQDQQIKQMKINQVHLAGYFGHFFNNNTFILNAPYVENLNLSNNLTHLTLELAPSKQDFQQIQINGPVEKIESIILEILKKRYFYQLKNVLLLFSLGQEFNCQLKLKFIDWVFDKIWTKATKTIFKSTSLEFVSIYAKAISEENENIVTRYALLDWEPGIPCDVEKAD